MRGTDERSARKRQFLCLISGKYNQRKETEEEAEEETSTTRRGQRRTNRRRIRRNMMKAEKRL